MNSKPAQFVLVTGFILVSDICAAPLPHVLQNESGFADLPHEPKNDDDLAHVLKKGSVYNSTHELEKGPVYDDWTLCGGLVYCRNVKEWCDKEQPSCESCEGPCSVYYPPPDINGDICKQNCAEFYQQTVDKMNRKYVIKLVRIGIGGVVGLIIIVFIVWMVCARRFSCKSICKINHSEEQPTVPDADDAPLLHEEPDHQDDKQDDRDQPGPPLVYREPHYERRLPQRLEEQSSSRTGAEHEESNQAQEAPTPKEIDEPEHTQGQPVHRPAEQEDLEEEEEEEGQNLQPDGQDDQSGNPGELEQPAEPRELVPHEQRVQPQEREERQPETPGELQPRRGREPVQPQTTGELEPRRPEVQIQPQEQEEGRQPETPGQLQPGRQRERDKRPGQRELDPPEREQHPPTPTDCSMRLQGQHEDLAPGSCLKGPIHKDTGGSRGCASNNSPAQFTTSTQAHDEDETRPKELEWNRGGTDQGYTVANHLRGNSCLEDQDDLKAEDPDEHQELTESGELPQETPLKTVTDDDDDEPTSDSLMSHSSTSGATSSTTRTIDLSKQQ